MSDRPSAGLLAGIGLTVATGVQNACVIRRRLLRRHRIAIGALCLVFDALPIGSGVALARRSADLGARRRGGSDPPDRQRY